MHTGSIHMYIVLTVEDIHLGLLDEYSSLIQLSRKQWFQIQFILFQVLFTFPISNRLWKQWKPENKNAWSDLIAASPQLTKMNEWSRLKPVNCLSLDKFWRINECFIIWLNPRPAGVASRKRPTWGGKVCLPYIIILIQPDDLTSHIPIERARKDDSKAYFGS